MRSSAEAVLAAFLCLAACDADDPVTTDPGVRSTEHTDTAPGSDPSPTDTGSDSGSAVCTELTYETYGRGFMTSWCTGCHHRALTGADRVGAPEGVDLETLDGVRAFLDRIEARAAADPPTMPPVGGASEEERARLREWLACGAP